MESQKLERVIEDEDLGVTSERGPDLGMRHIRDGTGPSTTTVQKCTHILFHFSRSFLLLTSIVVRADKDIYVFVRLQQLQTSVEAPCR
jgi:hypothetical protein